MKVKPLGVWLCFCFFIVVLSSTSSLYAATKPIVIGSPLPIAFVEGWGAERALRLAIEEINAKGGVTVGGVKHPFELSVMDTRDLEADVPVSDALLTVEKLILEKRADFIVGGPARSEAGLAAMDLLASIRKFPF